MPSLEVVVPIRVQRIEKSVAVAGDGLAVHERGFLAGYEEGQLRARWEAERSRQKDREELRRLMARLENLHHEFEGLMAEHLPELVQGALHRVFRRHPFTAEEIGSEVAALLHDMEQANRITLECSPAEAEELGRRLQESGSIPTGSDWALTVNPALESGEFLLKSDLGDIDGRHLSRVRQIRIAMETSS